MTTATLSKNYYFNMGTTIYFGNDERYQPFKSMDRYPIREVEHEAERLNKAAGLVAPVDDDYCEDEE
jgi:hypothetical protein